MGLFKPLLISVIFSSLAHPMLGIEKEQVTYLMQSKELEAALDLYQNYKREQGRHDFEVLLQMCTIILEQGIRSSDLSTQLCSLYGTSVAHLSSSLDILEEGIRSHNVETQLASIQLLASLHDDRGNELLTKAMASPFLGVRLEAGYYLAERKHRKATGHLESLMAKIPPEYGFYFPQFFALVGTEDAIQVLKRLMEDRFSNTRVEAILNAARFGRDDLISRIRAHATHSHPSEQEAAAAALGMLKDSYSIPKLKQLSQSGSAPVRLAALQSLYLLGDTEALLPIFEMAKNENLFAIALLGVLPGGDEVLKQLQHSLDIHVRFNATLSLLFRRNSSCLSTLFEFLIRNPKDLGFQPTFSLGHSLMAWKVVPSLRQNERNLKMDLSAVALQIRLQMLAACIELEEQEFLSVASYILDSHEVSLIPFLVQLLENQGSEEAILLLKKNSDKAGAPLVRMYCNLALFRLKQEGPYEKRLKDWIREAQKLEMMNFRSSIPWNIKNTLSTYELTPADSTRLLVECYEALSNQHSQESIEILLEGLRWGHPKNRYALAGLLIRTLQ